MPRVPHHVKRGRFHQAAEALVTAYSKEISNESCREASKTLVMMNHSALKASKNRPAKFGPKFILKCQHTSIKTRRD